MKAYGLKNPRYTIDYDIKVEKTDFQKIALKVIAKKKYNVLYSNGHIRDTYTLQGKYDDPKNYKFFEDLSLVLTLGYAVSFN
jgi:hypothetical protein